MDQGKLALALADASESTATTVFTHDLTTADGDAVVVSYNLVVRNSSLQGGPSCGIASFAELDGEQSTQSVFQVVPGVDSGGQTVVFRPAGGAHTLSVKAWKSVCPSAAADYTEWPGGRYSSTLTTMVLKQ